MIQRILSPFGMVLALLLVWSSNSHSHIVGLGYTFIGNEIKFDALHWHGAHPAAGFLNVNGVDYAFESVSWDVNEMTGLDGALVNSIYSEYDEDTGVLTALGTLNPWGPVNNWLHVYVPNPGTEFVTLSTVWGPGGLTSWTLDGGISQIDISQPPSVPEPGTMVLIGLGILGIAASKRRRRQI